MKLYRYYYTIILHIVCGGGPQFSNKFVFDQMSEDINRIIKDGLRQIIQIVAKEQANELKRDPTPSEIKQSLFKRFPKLSTDDIVLNVVDIICPTVHCEQKIAQETPPPLEVD